MKFCILFLVGGERIEKLKQVIRKIFQKHGKIITEHYPLNEKGETKGYIFLEYAKHSEAVETIKQLNNHKMDKNHTFQINLFSDFEKFENIPDVWEPPKEESYTNQGERKSFLMNEAAHDQYAVVFQGGEQVGVYRNALPDALKEEERPRWTESYIRLVLNSINIFNTLKILMRKVELRCMSFWRRILLIIIKKKHINKKNH